MPAVTTINADTLASQVIAASHNPASAETMRDRLIELVHTCEANNRRDIVDNAFDVVDLYASMALSRLTTRMAQAGLL